MTTTVIPARTADETRRELLAASGLAVGGASCGDDEDREANRASRHRRIRSSWPTT